MLAKNEGQVKSWLLSATPALIPSLALDPSVNYRKDSFLRLFSQSIGFNISNSLYCPAWSVKYLDKMGDSQKWLALSNFQQPL